jgi:hypothetical protein
MEVSMPASTVNKQKRKQQQQQQQQQTNHLVSGLVQLYEPNQTIKHTLKSSFFICLSVHLYQPKRGVLARPCVHIA